MWNDEKIIPIRLKRLIIYFISIVLSISLIYIAFNFIIPAGATTEVYISTIAVLLTVIGFILSITNQIITKQLSTDMRISLDTTVVHDDVIISCTVENKGFDSINNMDFYLFIDQPKLNSLTRLYEYKHVLRHGYDYQKCTISSFCSLSDACLNYSICEYPEWLKESSQENIFYGFKKLDFLSDASVMYINSGELFTEDVAFNLKKGVYRAILVGRFNKNKKGCLCANKQFIIS